MGCYCTKTKETQQQKQRNSQIILPKDEHITQSFDYIKEDFEKIKPLKICVISNSYKEKSHTPRVIGGKKEIFSQLYIRPYQKK